MYRLNNDQTAAKQLKEQGEAVRKKNWQAAKKAVDRFGEPDYKKTAAVRSIQVMIKRSQKVRNG